MPLIFFSPFITSHDILACWHWDSSRENVLSSNAFLSMRLEWKCVFVTKLRVRCTLEISEGGSNWIFRTRRSSSPWDPVCWLTFQKHHQNWSYPTNVSCGWSVKEKFHIQKDPVIIWPEQIWFEATWKCMNLCVSKKIWISSVVSGPILRPWSLLQPPGILYHLYSTARDRS